MTTREIVLDTVHSMGDSPEEIYDSIFSLFGEMFTMPGDEVESLFVSFASQYVEIPDDISYHLRHSPYGRMS